MSLSEPRGPGEGGRDAALLEVLEQGASGESGGGGGEVIEERNSRPCLAFAQCEDPGVGGHVGRKKLLLRKT